MDKQIALEVMALMKRSKEHIYSEMYREPDLQNPMTLNPGRDVTRQ